MYETMSEIRAAHTGNWFSKGALRFFSSRLSKKVYPVAVGAYFVSSERREGCARRYSVRFCDELGNIHTVGDFQQHDSASQAHATAKYLSGKNCDPRTATDHDNPIQLWVCTNCIQHAANGECGDCHEDFHEGGEPLSLVSHKRSSVGFAQEFHGCGRQDDTYFGECDCEYDPYSTMACGGCGSMYYGERHAMTEWPLLSA